jgi:hypothetical protein
MAIRFWLVLAASCLLCPAVAPAQNASPLKPLNLDKLNSEGDEDDPFALPDGITLLYTKKVEGLARIHISSRASASAAWPAGKVFMKSNKEADERTPFFHKASSMLYFATNEVVDPNLQDQKNFDILRKLEQTAPVPLQAIDTPEDELGPWLTPSGKEFYFSRQTRKGWALYSADGPTPGPIGNAKQVGFPPGYCRCTLTTSGLVMYLQGPVAGSDEKTAIYRSRRTKVGAPWSPPELVAGLSHPDGSQGDMSPSLSTDGTRLYFVSDRPGGKGGLDIWNIQVSQLK